MRRTGDHFRQDHGDGLQRLDLDLFVAAGVGVLDRKYADRAFEPDNRNSGEAVEPFLSGFRAIGESRVLGGLGEVEDPPFGGDGADQALAHPQLGHVNSLFAEAVGGEQLELVVAQQIDRADLALHLVGDQIDDPVQFGLGRSARRHHVVETGQDLAG